MSKEIFIRLGVSDLVISKEEEKTFSGYITMVDKDGEYVRDLSTYFVCYEDEEGNEVDEEGNLL
jgi:hypothetical protein